MVVSILVCKQGARRLGIKNKKKPRLDPRSSPGVSRRGVNDCEKRKESEKEGASKRATEGR